MMLVATQIINRLEYANCVSNVSNNVPKSALPKSAPKSATS